MGMDLNSLVYGNPPLRYISSWKTIGKELFADAEKAGVIAEFIANHRPPANESGETREELQRLAGHRPSPAELALYTALDEDSYGFFARFSEQIGVPITREEFAQETDRYLGVISYIKFRFNRPRPHQLAWYYRINLFPLVRSGTANSASYPSGHTLEFLAMMRLIEKRSPESRDKLTELYRRIRGAREMVGLHYQSDTRGSEILFGMLKDKGLV